MTQKISTDLTPPAWAVPFLTRLLDVATPLQLLKADNEDLAEMVGRIRCELTGRKWRVDEPYRGLPTVAAVRDAVVESLPAPERAYWHRRLERRSQNPEKPTGPLSFDVTGTDAVVQRATD